MLTLLVCVCVGEHLFPKPHARFASCMGRLHSVFDPQNCIFGVLCENGQNCLPQIDVETWLCSTCFSQGTCGEWIQIQELCRDLN